MKFPIRVAPVLLMFACLPAQADLMSSVRANDTEAAL